MAREIERKFLVLNDEWRGLGQAVLYRQGYLSSVKERTVRVRTAGGKAFIAVKGISRGVTRQEFEYEIPLADAVQILETLAERPLIEKRRTRAVFAGRTWEIDEFLGENRGLTVAEVELEAADAPLQKPSWAGEEVSDDPRYFNSNLVRHPYTSWLESLRR